jgi:hypothetical protein
MRSEFDIARSSEGERGGVVGRNALWLKECEVWGWTCVLHCQRKTMRLDR